MIGRRGKALILAYVAFLTVLFLMCSTDLIIREPEREVYQIAVIIEDVRDDNYVNFRKGIEQAAMEFHGDVQFITLYKRLDGDQQIELMSREQQDGAHALIIIPADEERVVSALAQGQVSVPVVLLGSGQAGEGAAGTIAPDHKAMGECLAREMAVRMDEGCQAVIFEETGRKSAMDRLFLEGAKDVFEGGEYRAGIIRGCFGSGKPGTGGRADHDPCPEHRAFDGDRRDIWGKSRAFWSRSLWKDPGIWAGAGRESGGSSLLSRGRRRTLRQGKYPRGLKLSGSGADNRDLRHGPVQSGIPQRGDGYPGPGGGRRTQAA